MTQKTTISNDPTSGEPVYVREGDQVAFAIRIKGVASTLASPTMEFFKIGTSTDVSSTYWTGTMSVSGINTITTKTTQNLKAGDYILSVFATVDGQVMNVVTVPFFVKRKSER